MIEILLATVVLIIIIVWQNQLLSSIANNQNLQSGEHVLNASEEIKLNVSPIIVILVAMIVFGIGIHRLIIQKKYAENGSLAIFLAVLFLCVLAYLVAKPMHNDQQTRRFHGGAIFFTLCLSMFTMLYVLLALLTEKFAIK